MEKIGLGGGCHWCTEAVFQSLKGVQKVAQGYLSSKEDDSTFSEGVIVEFDPQIIPIHILLEIHLLTHSSSSNHSMRPKYRSAVYVFSDVQREAVTKELKKIKEFNKLESITEVLCFGSFRTSRKELLNYYYKNPEKPFCSTYIDPKIKLLQRRFSAHVDQNKTKHLSISYEES